MALPNNRKRVSASPTKDGSSPFHAGPSKKASTKTDSSSGSFLEAGPSKAFTDSTVRLSTSGSGARLSLGRRKLSVEATLPMNDDCTELIEEKEKSLAEQEKSMNKSSHKAEEELDVSIVKTMTPEQMQEHVSRCLQLSTENKINTKNAFALKLIDCMTIITKSDDKSNFAAMACQLDAGAKIYSSRVDAVHQQVVKLVETCMFAAKNKKGKSTDDDNAEDCEEDNEGEEQKDKEKKKKTRKKVISTNDQISRRPKENDPKDMFIRLEALPGDILSKARYSPGDLSLTLDKHSPFWMDWPHYKATRPEGENFIPEIEITNHKLRPKVDLDAEIDLASIPKLEPLLTPKTDANQEKVDNTDMDQDGVLDNSNHDSQSMGFESFHGEEVPSDDDNEDGGNIEVVNVAKLRMAEGTSRPSTHDVIKTLFHKQGESDYHYLKMDSSNLWAGPSYWKRPQDYNLAENKKKMIRKKREPVEVQYTGDKTEKEMRPRDSEAASSSRKAPCLSKKTISKWSNKKVTYPEDIHFDPETFYMLYNVNIIAEVVHQDIEELDKQKSGEETHNFEDDDNAMSPDMFDQPDTEGFHACGSQSSTSFRGFPSPSSSTLDSQNGFRGFPSPSGSTSPFDPEHGFRGFGSPPTDETNTQDTEPSNPSTIDNDGETPDPGACDAYEGENLVPMVKTVKVDPIRIVAKPNRVDMQHLKRVMLNIIRRAIEDRENKLKDEGLQSPRGSVAFRDVLTQLFSSDKLHHRTKEDLTVQMAFLCLLTLTNENDFSLKKDESEDVLIMYDAQQTPAV